MKKLLPFALILLLASTGNAQFLRAAKVVAVGDSVMRGYQNQNTDYLPTRAPTHGENHLSRAVALSGGRLTLLANASNGGESTGDMLARFSRDALGFGVPDIVVIMGGSLDSVKGLTSDDTIRNLDQMIALARGFGAVPVVCAPPPWAGPRAAIVAGLRPRIRDLALLRGVRFVDQWARVGDPLTLGWSSPKLTTEGLHPSRLGEQCLANNLWDRLEPMIRYAAPALTDLGDLGNMLVNGCLLDTADRDGKPYGWYAGKVPDALNLRSFVVDAYATGRWARLTHTGMTSFVHMRQSITGGFAPGDLLRFSSRIRARGFEGRNHLYTIRVRFNGSDQQWYPAYRWGYDTADRGLAVTSYARVPEGTTSVEVMLYTEARIETVGDCRLDAAQLQIVKVPPDGSPSAP